MKNSLFPVSIVLAVIAVFLIFNSTQTVRNVRQTLDVERYQRMTAEEKLQQAEGRIHRLENQVNDSQSKLEKIQAVLNESETAQMDSNQQKAVLELQLKEYQNSNLVAQPQDNATSNQ